MICSIHFEELVAANLSFDAPCRVCGEPVAFHSRASQTQFAFNIATFFRFFFKLLVITVCGLVSFGLGLNFFDMDFEIFSSQHLFSNIYIPNSTFSNSSFALCTIKQSTCNLRISSEIDVFENTKIVSELSLLAPLPAFDGYWENADSSSHYCYYNYNLCWVRNLLISNGEISMSRDTDHVWNHVGGIMHCRKGANVNISPNVCHRVIVNPTFVYNHVMDLDFSSLGHTLGEVIIPIMQAIQMGYGFFFFRHSARFICCAFNTTSSTQFSRMDRFPNDSRCIHSADYNRKYFDQHLFQESSSWQGCTI